MAAASFGRRRVPAHSTLSPGPSGGALDEHLHLLQDCLVKRGGLFESLVTHAQGAPDLHACRDWSAPEKHLGEKLKRRRK